MHRNNLGIERECSWGVAEANSETVDLNPEIIDEKEDVVLMMADM